MTSPGALGRVREAGPGSPRDAHSALRRAFGALARVPPGARPTPGALGPTRLPAGPREAWLGGVHEAIAESGVVCLVVTPATVLYADTPLLDGPDAALADRLYTAGIRALTIFAGAPEPELQLLGALLAAEWPSPQAVQDAVWAEDLPHAWFDLAEAAGASPPRATPVAPLARLELAPEEPRRVSALSADASAALHDLRATAAPEPVGLLDANAASGPTAELLAEVALVQAGTELDPAQLTDAIARVLDRHPDGEAAARGFRALLALVVDLLPVADVGPLVHHALDRLDADFAPDEARRALAAEAFAILAEDPLRTRLAARLPATELPELKGPLFSLFSLLRAEGDVGALAEALPRWAARILADTVLLRDPAEPNARLDAVRGRLASPSTAMVVLGLAVAARTDEPRLLDTVLALADHASPDVREAALVALRSHAGARAREVALRLLDDPAVDVRIEALRYGVAHRLPEVLPRVEARLRDGAAGIEDAEGRALCIAWGRLAREAAEGPLLEIALGRRRLGPAFARHALHGLRAVGTPGARAAIEHAAAEVPRLREEAQALLGEAR